MATTEERVLAILREHLDRVFPIETGSNFIRDLNMDEIEAPEIIFALEESFNISIAFEGRFHDPSDLFFFTAQTVGDLIHYVDRLVAEQS